MTTITNSWSKDHFKNLKKCQTARKLLLPGRSRKPGLGGIHGGERGLVISLLSFDSFIYRAQKDGRKTGAGKWGKS